jgi:carbamoyl-phosphate synthase large subunit
MSSLTPLTIAVTGLNATDNPAPGVPVIRAIRDGADGQCRIIGLSYDPLDPGNYLMNIADHIFLMPYPNQGADVLFERLSYIHDRFPIDVIMPTLDAELPLYIKLSSRLAEMGIHTFLPDEKQLQLRAKDRLDDLRKNCGISVPKSITLNDPRPISDLDQELDFPVMVKGQFYDASIAYSPMEVESHFYKLQAKWGVPVIVQEFVTGEEFDVVAVGDGRGGLIGAVPMRKMQLTDKGKAWGGVTIEDPQLMRFVDKIMAKLQWRGPCELEVMQLSESGGYTLIEINPRFPAWVYLSVGAGCNLPWAAVCLALGETIESMCPPLSGVMFLRHSHDQICSLSDYGALATSGELNRMEMIA